ncbi:hypothetical protein [Bacillus sp. B-jedd]|uniref:hypothetical protein n=1 Tax=Bacillus sp. B-jedd TaxID=1476857 RepID=UPI0005155C13|nr:hypothetical protein [Bacillus sp. B-jedd]CEG26560.1 hypothetical protein BN1002_01408 [Bacillus sp. B-jedd]
MPPLTNEEIVQELSKFPRHKLNQAQKNGIASSLSKSQPARRPMGSLFPAMLNFLVVAVLIAGLSTLLINFFSGSDPWHPGTEVYKGKKFSFDPMGVFAVKKLSNEEAEFYQGDKKVGGIEILTEKGMHQNIQQQNVFESANLPGYRYHLHWTLDHQKTMEASQIRHYFFLSEKSKLRYHVYFYTPYVEDLESDAIARTLRIRD